MCRQQRDPARYPASARHGRGRSAADLRPQAALAPEARTEEESSATAMSYGSIRHTRRTWSGSRARWATSPRCHRLASEPHTVRIATPTPGDNADLGLVGNRFGLTPAPAQPTQ